MEMYFYLLTNKDFIIIIIIVIIIIIIIIIIISYFNFHNIVEPLLRGHPQDQGMGLLNWSLQKPQHTIILFPCHSNILH